MAEGDVSIYSSTHYIATQLEERGISIRHHAGIPSFIAAASALNISLVEGNEMLVVSPGKVSRELLQSVADGGGTLVVMKLSQCEAELKALMPHFAPYLQYYYCEFVERPNALYLHDLEAIQTHPFTYFPYLSANRINPVQTNETYQPLPIPLGRNLFVTVLYLEKNQPRKDSKFSCNNSPSR